MRVAVTQFATSLNVEENLATCIRMINEAAVCEPSLIVLPGFCNKQLLYTDHNQAWNEALPINGLFLKAIAEQAKKHNCYIVLNVTLQRDTAGDLSQKLPHNFSENKQDDVIQSTVKSNISITSCILSPLGVLINHEDTQTLTEHEKSLLVSNNKSNNNHKVFEVVTTPFGKVGLLAGNDDITFEASRALSLSGAQLLCSSINSFTLDQSNLHGPTRACENKVFLAAANKIGLLVPPENPLQKNNSEKCISQEKSTTPQEHLVGVGQSQIVSPNGKVLAKITHNEEGFTFADIDMAEAGINSNNKCRPDGTELFKQRRPELYQALTQSIKLHENGAHENKVPVTANVAIFATYKTNDQAIEDVCHYIENNLSDIIQLPELFFIADKAITNNAEQRAQIECLSKQLINQVSVELRPFQYVCTSLIIEGVHQAVIISEHGLFATQQQLHFCKRYQWTELGNDLNIIELPLEQGNINVAILTADDANIPEIVKVTALNNIHVLLVAFDIQEPCEVEYSLLSRAAEHRICIVAASREKNFVNDFIYKPTSDNGNNIFNKNKNKNKNKEKLHKSTGFIANLTIDFAQHSEQLSRWKSRKFNGYINQPIVKHQHGKITKAVIHPIASCNKQIATKVS